MSKRFPFKKQEGMYDCGSACVLMILKYYKGDISYLELMELLKTTKKGTTAFHIVETLNYLGFEAEGIKTNLKDIPILPAIAHVIMDKTYKHYVVIYQIKNDKIYIADPAKGFCKYTFSEFEKIWTNTLITMHPISKIYNNQKSNLKRYLFNVIVPHKTQIIIILVLSLFITIFSVILSFTFGIIINTNKVLNCFLIFTFLTLIKILLEYICNKVLIKMNAKIDYSLTTNSFKKIINLPYIYYHGKKTGDIVSRITDLSNIKDLLSTGFITILSYFPLMILSGVILFYLNAKLFLIVIATTLFYILITIVFHKKIKRQIYLLRQQYASGSSYMVESITNFETIKNLNIENQIITKQHNIYNDYTKYTSKLLETNNNLFFWKEFITNLGNLSIIILGILFVKNDLLSLGNLIAFIFLSSYFITPIKNIVDLNLEFKEAILSLRRIMEITFYKESNGNIKLRPKKFQFQNLSYTFNDLDFVLKNINLEIKTNEKIIILGSSGSGKSTLLKLMVGYYKSEALKINDIPIKKLDTMALKDKIVCASQNEKLFTGTLKDNLQITNNQSLDKVIEITCIEEIISKDPLGLYQLIEEDGFNLSGGEKQRIVLARALLKDFDFLLIDESLNQVSVSLERKILKNIFLNYPGKTIVFVSHRTDNVDIFERLITLESGKVINDLKKNKGEIYAKNEGR